MLRESVVFVYYFNVLILLCFRWEFSVIVFLGMTVFFNAELFNLYQKGTLSIMFNEICINEEMLPKYIYIYICVCVCECVCVCVCMCVCVFTQPLRTSRMWHEGYFKESLIGLNSKFSFSHTSCHTKVKELSLLYYLLITGDYLDAYISQVY